jgi:uncharacterized lipoprotein YmbA
LAALVAALSGCSAAPEQRLYLLGDPATPTIGVRPETGIPIIALARIVLPDYLDSTDILRRSGASQIVPSSTGRWGERLSKGIADALQSALTRDLPAMAVTTAPVPHPALRLFVQIDSFDIGDDGRCLLAAGWRITAGDGQNAVKSASGIFAVNATAPDDDAIALAMTLAIDQLAQQIAATALQAPAAAGH